MPDPQLVRFAPQVRIRDQQQSLDPSNQTFVAFQGDIEEIVALDATFKLLKLFGVHLFLESDVEFAFERDGFVPLLLLVAVIVGEVEGWSWDWKKRQR